MNKKFLELIEKEKPDYIFLGMRPGEPDAYILPEIRKISPKTKIFTLFADDDIYFEIFSRYIILFFDYGLLFQRKYLSNYKNEGSENVFPITMLNTTFFRPLDIEKKYDVIFIGAPKTKLSRRYEYIKFLKENGVKIKLFGLGWANYPDFKDIYGGVLSSEEMIKIINQSKIYLCLSKNDYGEPHMTLKFLEGSACKTFVLTEYFKEYLKLFKENKEIIMFKNKNELLQKINYYLKNDNEREKIAKAGYKKVLNNYNLDVEFKKMLEKSKRNKSYKHKGLPKINKKIICLYKKDFNLDLENLKKKIKDYDYVFFNNGKCENLKYRKYLQAYSLEKSGKSISCCDYYVYSKLLGNYLYFFTDNAFQMVNKLQFDSFLNINQIMVTKNYFLKNIKMFNEILNGAKIDFVNKENTIFVSIPLIRINKFKFGEYKIMKKVFQFKFLGKLYSLKYRKKFLSIYPFVLFFEILKGEIFILKSIVDILKDKDKRERLKSFERM